MNNKRMKYYDKEGKEISKTTFYKKVAELKKNDYPLYYSEDKVNRFKRLWH